MKRAIDFIIALAVGGVAISLYSYLETKGITSAEFCSIGSTFNCDLVNSSPYAKLAGIPVSLLGIIGYGLVLVAAIMKKKQMDDHGLTQFLLLASGGGLAFALYLTGIEAFVLQAYCMLCLTSQAIILALFILVFKMWRDEKKKSREQHIHSV